MAGVAPLLEKLEPMAMMEEGGLQRASIAIKLLAHKSATDPSVGGGILEARGVRILLQEALGNDVLAERLAQRLARKAGGVPFFVLEMLRGLEETGALRRATDGHFVQQSYVESIDVPGAVRDLIAGRLRDLSRDERTLLDVAAVQGYDFDACWRDYRLFTFAGVIMAVIASMIVEVTERGDEMFMAMASRHAQHALDLEAFDLIE